MKKLLVLLVFFIATVCSAQVSLQVNGKGEYQKQ